MYYQIKPNGLYGAAETGRPMVSITISADKPEEAAEVIQAINNSYADKIAEIVTNSPIKLNPEKTAKGITDKAAMNVY